MVDGGPDENPRYGETIKYACANFLYLKLDALFVATQAPGRSAYNPVERRMAPLSRFLAGIILPYETFGSHLNSQGLTIDTDREKSNFKKAGETLAEVWNEAVIDSFPVLAEWRGGIKAEEPAYPSQQWLVSHVRASQYFLQIVKCNDEECCAAPTSSLSTVLQHRFFPAPLPIMNTEGIDISDLIRPEVNFLSLFQRLSMNVKHSGLQDINDCPYDLFCPTVRLAVKKRTCHICRLYFPSQAMVAAHKTAVHKGIQIHDIPKIRPIRVAARRQRELMTIIASGEMEDVEWLDESQVDTTGLTVPSHAPHASRLPVIADFDGDPWQLE